MTRSTITIEQESSTDCIWEDTMALFESCRSTDTNLLLASVAKWEDMGCTPGTTLEYSLLLQLHETQKPSISQGLYPILLLALSALTTSAYTSLGVSQDLNPQHQLLKASVYHSATSAVGIILSAGGAESMMLSACAESMILSLQPWMLVVPLKRLEVLRQDRRCRLFRCSS